MSKPIRYLIFLLALACALGALWVYSHKLLELSTGFIESEQLQIHDIEIESLGLDQTHIRILKGQLYNNRGLFGFALRDATLHYDIGSREISRVAAKQVEVDIDLVRKNTAQPTTETSDFQLIIPPNVEIDHATIVVHSEWGEHLFDGTVQSTLAGDRIVFSARDSNNQYSAETDLALTRLNVSATANDGNDFAQLELEFSADELKHFKGSASVKPLREWIGQNPLIPDEFKNLFPTEYQVEGTLDYAGTLTEGAWLGNMALNFDEVETETILAKARANGEITTDGDRIYFTTETGVIDGQVKAENDNEVPIFFSFQIPGKYQMWWSASKAQAQSNDSLAFSLSYDDVTIDAQIDTWVARNPTPNRGQEFDTKLSQVKLSPYSIAATAAEAEFTITEFDPLSLRGTASFTNAHSLGWTSNVDGIHASGEWTWHDDALTMGGQTTWGSIPEVPWSLNHQNSSGQFKLNFELPVTDLAAKIQQYARLEELTPTKGTVKAELNVAWSGDEIQNELDIIGTGLYVKVEGMQLQDGELRIKSSDLTTPIFDIQSVFDKAILANEVEVFDLSAGAQLKQSLYLGHVNLRAFGGRLSLRPTEIDFDAVSHKLDVDISGMELNEILAMVEQPGLEGNGKLSGTLPLRITDGAIELENGKLLNLTSGVLRYRVGDGETPEQLDNIALQALRDFRFDVLESTVNYSKNGDYVIKARIEGKNPELYDGYPIAFNLNLSGSLPGLARAGILTGDFHSELLKTIEQEQRKISE